MPFAKPHFARPQKFSLECLGMLRVGGMGDAIAMGRYLISISGSTAIADDDSDDDDDDGITHPPIVEGRCHISGG